MYSAKVEGVHKEFQKAVRAGVCRFIPETGNLMLISTEEASQKKARMIQEMHFRNLSQKVLSSILTILQFDKMIFLEYEKLKCLKNDLIEGFACETYRRSCTPVRINKTAHNHRRVSSQMCS